MNNVIWFVLDTLRSDHLGCYGYWRDTSPHIDRIAAEGVLFEDSYASAIATGPGFTGLFTGLAAINHGFYLTPWNVPNQPLLDDDTPTLPELIQYRGDYTTAAFDNLINFKSHMKQFVRGFEYYVNVTRSPAFIHHHILGDELNERLLPWLEHQGDRPFFTFVHYWDPHTPYNHPPAFRGRFDAASGDLVTVTAPDGYTYVPGWGPADALPEPTEQMSIDLYDDEVRYTDHCVGVVREQLEELGLLDSTAIIITADHGEDLDLHGAWGHSTAHETTIRVPLIVRDPKRLPQGRRVKGFVQHADNLPTILEYFPHVGISDPERARYTDKWFTPTDTFDGASLIDLATGKRNAPGEIVVETGEHRAFLAPPWKLIWYADGTPSELFHLVNDPLEINNRAADEPAIAKELAEKLQAWVDAHLKGQRTDPIHSVTGAWTCYVGAKDNRDE